MSIQKQDIVQLTDHITEEWKNFPVSEINDHVVRVSVLQKDFYWHKHSKSDEFFFVVEGELFVDFEDKTEVLTKGQMIKVPKNVIAHLLEDHGFDLIFGGAGLKKDTFPQHLQRFPVESGALTPMSSLMKNEYAYYVLKSFIGRNKIRRK